METHSSTGILLISFGTSHSETEKKTIEAMEQRDPQCIPPISGLSRLDQPRIISKLKKSVILSPHHRKLCKNA